jgi:hypothetical protein
MANKSISQLTAGAAVSGTDIFPDVQTAGVGPVKVTATQLATYFWNSPTLVTPSLGAATATSINIGGATLGSNVLAYNGSAIGTSLALGGATLGSNVLAVTGTTLLGGTTTVSTGGLTIGVAGTTGGTIALKGSTAGTLTLQVPATVTDYSITFPSAVAAANGYILTSTTAGVTSWTNPTALGVDLDVGTTAITNGTVGRVLFENTGNVLGEASSLTITVANNKVNVVSAPFGLSGNISSTAWTTSGIRYQNVAATLTDTSSSGTVAAAYTDLFGGNTIAASSSTTFTNYYTMFVTQPTAGTNVTLTNRWAFGTTGNVRIDGSLTLTTPLTVGNGGTGTSTAFTAGSVVFAGASGVYSQDNANFFWDDTNNWLGIGTASPNFKLNVVSATDTTIALFAGTARAVRIATTATTGSIEGVDQTGASSYQPLQVGGSALNFSISGSTKATLDSNFNFLIGGIAVRATTAGAAHLDLFNGTAPAGTLTNGISLYSSSGDFLFMDATGAAYKVGYRNIPQNAQTSAYVAAIGDVGEHISITTGGVTVNASVFSAGDVFTIYNNSGSSQTITAGASVTFQLAGTATTGNRTLAQRGLGTVLCVVGGATPTFVISGAGVT